MNGGQWGKKRACHFSLGGGGVFAFAGLWDAWVGGPRPLLTCCLITTHANDLVRPVHDRMPVILPPESYAPWLDPEAPEARVAGAAGVVASGGEVVAGPAWVVRQGAPAEQDGRLVSEHGRPRVEADDLLAPGRQRDQQECDEFRGRPPVRAVGAPARTGHRSA